MKNESRTLDERVHYRWSEFFLLIFFSFSLALSCFWHIWSKAYLCNRETRAQRAYTTHHIATSFTEIKFIFRHFQCINNNDDLYDVLGSSPFLYASLYVSFCHTTLSFFLFIHLLVRFWSLSYLLACSLARSLACLQIRSMLAYSFAWHIHRRLKRETSQSLDAKIYVCWVLHLAKNERNDCMRFWTDNSNYEFHVRVRV